MSNRIPNRFNLQSFAPSEAARFLIQAEGNEAFDFAFIRANEASSTAEFNFWRAVEVAIAETQIGGAR